MTKKTEIKAYERLPIMILAKKTHWVIDGKVTCNSDNRTDICEEEKADLTPELEVVA